MTRSSIVLVTVLISLFSAVTAADVGPEDKGQAGAVTGWVRDLACLMRYKQVVKPQNGCAEMCARLGAPLVLVTSDGTIYVPISTRIPDTSQRELLMPHVGKYAQITGHIFERSGMRAISIEKIQDVAQ